MYRVLSAFALVLLLTACAGVQTPPSIPSEVRAAQHREFNVSADDLFVAVMEALHELDYMVENADRASGFITARTSGSQRHDFWTGSLQRSALRLTAFVREQNDGSSVRLNLAHSQTYVSEAGYSDQRDIPVTDSELYLDVYESIERALFSGAPRHGRDL